MIVTMKWVLILTWDAIRMTAKSSDFFARARLNNSVT